MTLRQFVSSGSSQRSISIVILAKKGRIPRLCVNIGVLNKIIVCGQVPILALTWEAKT